MIVLRVKRFGFLGRVSGWNNFRNAFASQRGTAAKAAGNAAAASTGTAASTATSTAANAATGAASTTNAAKGASDTITMGDRTKEFLKGSLKAGAIGTTAYAGMSALNTTSNILTGDLKSSSSY